jgi:5,6,7,8-tetrahydromethanopterin hydro-lyase
VTDSQAVLIGEGFAGDGAEAAHINVVFGDRAGPVSTAWATALETPSADHTPFVAVLRPGVPVKPLTLLVNKAAIAGAEHSTLTWGAAQAGVAAAAAIDAATCSFPDLADVLAARAAPSNPFFAPT